MSTATQTVGAVKFIVKRNVTLPILKMDPSKTYYVRLDTSIFKAPEDTEGRRKPKEGAPVMAAPELIDVLDYEDGTIKRVIVNTVLGSILRETYPNDSYKGLSFEIAKNAPTGGKRYATYQIAEIEVESEASKETPKAAIKK